MFRVSLLLVALVCLECCYSATIPRPFDARLSDDVILSPKKRPFCNAFTAPTHKEGLGSSRKDEVMEITNSFIPQDRRQLPAARDRTRVIKQMDNRCGRKRSQATPGMPMNEVVRQRQFIDEDTIGSLMDSDNAIDELSRQILSEAKLWEAIQDASAEIARRKQKEIYN